MPEYIVVHGTHRRADGSVANEGDAVSFTTDERDRFPAEKFERVESEPSDVSVPDDWEVLRKMASLHDSDDVTGVMSSDDIAAYFEDEDPSVVESLRDEAREQLEE